jgi:hypothetical protein
VIDANLGKPGVQIDPAECPQPDFIARNSADNTAGTIKYAVTQLSPTPAFSGDCTVAHIHFAAQEATPTMVTFAELILSDDDFGQIASEAIDIRLGDPGMSYVYLPSLLSP